MKMTYCTFIGLLLLTFQACNRTTPERYVGATALNSNLVSAAYRPAFLKELIELKNKNGLPGATAVDYVNDRAVKPVEESIKKIKGLNKTADTKALIAAALDVMEYGRQVFKSDYLAIAQLIDAGKPQQIEAAIAAMYGKTEKGMIEKFDRLDNLALTYAKKHDVPFAVK